MDFKCAVCQSHIVVVQNQLYCNCGTRSLIEVGLDTAQMRVLQFMQKYGWHGLGEPRKLTEFPLPTPGLADICEVLGIAASVASGAAASHPLAARLSLLIEEVHELAVAITYQDEIETADALADILYVLLGTANFLTMPLGPLFEEVASSNLTKDVDNSATQLKPVKGPQYKSPDINKALNRGRVLRKVGESFKAKSDAEAGNDPIF